MNFHPLGSSAGLTEDFRNDQFLLFQKMNGVAWGFLGIYSVVYFWLEYPLALWAVTSGALFTCPLVWWLCQKKRVHEAQVVFFSSCCLYVYLASLCLKHQVFAEVYFIPAIMLPVLFIDWRRVKTIVALVLLPILFWLLIQFAGYEFVPAAWLAQEVPAGWLVRFNFLGSFVMAFVALFLFVAGIRKQMALRWTAIIELRQWSAWQKAVLDGSPYSIIATTQNGLISTFNRAAESMLGYSAAELSNPNRYLLRYDSEDATCRIVEQTPDVLGAAAAASIPVNAIAARAGTDPREWTYVRKDGTLLPVRLKVTSIVNTSGQCIGFVSMAEDLTEHKALIETIEAQRAQMISTSKMSLLGEMSAGIAHELNNPLTIVIGTVRAIRRRKGLSDDSTEPIALDLKKIEETAFRMAKIIQGLVGFARNAEADPFKPTELASIVGDTLGLCGERFKSHGIDVRLSLPSQPVILHCIGVQISQVLMNLLNNALDAVEPLKERWVEIEAVVREGRLRLSITDSGSGIPPSIAEKIMTPFFTTKEVGNGTGIGLSICSSILKGHGGTLCYDANHPNTRFSVDLPVA